MRFSWFFFQSTIFVEKNWVRWLNARPIKYLQNKLSVFEGRMAVVNFLMVIVKTLEFSLSLGEKRSQKILLIRIQDTIALNCHFVSLNSQ